MNTVLHGQERLRSVLRLVLALASLLIYFGDASEHPARRPFAQAVLGLFLVYSVIAYFLAERRGRYVPAQVAPWLDFGWVTLLVAVSEGTSNIFYPLYLFPILYASFGQGFVSGIVVALASAGSFALIGVLTTPGGPGDELNAFVTRPLYLLVLGYLIAVWGGHEVRSRRRLALLRDVTALSNPRFGVDRTVANVLEAVRKFYDADACWLVVSDEHSKRRWARMASRLRGGAPDHVDIPEDLGEILLPPTGAFVVDSRHRWSGRRMLHVEHGERGPSERAAHVDEERAPAELPDVEPLMDALEADTLLSVPFRFHASAQGRLHVVRARPRRFDRAEIDFVRHVLDQVVPVLENLRLVDRLASDAATEERRRIARDLHDSLIQPYVALRLGLAAADSALAAGRTDEGTSRVRRLVELADGEIETLRGYLRALRAGDGAAPGGLLDAGVRRFCSRFAEATGIRVDVVIEGQPVKNDRLAAEVFQMIAEGLSNVRRHTSARRTEVRIHSAEDRLQLTVSNDAATPQPAEFRPRSLGERAAALGGTVRVDHPERGTTAVFVDIPL